MRRFGLGEVRALAMSPDLRWVASGGPTGAFLWDVENPGQAEFLEASGAVTAMGFTRDGASVFAAVGASVRSWDVASKALRRDLRGHLGEIGRLCFSPDGKTLASTSADNTVRLWSLVTGETTSVLRIPGSSILDASFSPDGRLLATVDTYLTNAVKVWDLGTGTIQGVLPATNWVAQRCLFTPTGQLVTVSADRQLTLWDVALGRQIRSFGGITGTTTMVVDLWLTNESTLGALLSDGLVLLWNLESGLLLRTAPGEFVTAGVGVPGEHLVLESNLDWDARLRQLPGGDVVRAFRGHTTSTHTGVAYSPDGRWVLSGGTERSMRLWDRQSGELLRTFSGSAAGTASVGFTPDGSQVYSTVGVPQSGVRFWNAASGEFVRKFEWGGAWPTCAAVSPDGKRLAAGAMDQQVRVYDMTSGNQVGTRLSEAAPARLAFAPHKPWLAIGGSDSSLVVLDDQRGQKAFEVITDAGPVTGLMFSSRGDALLVAWQGGLVRVYETERFEVRREILPRTGFLDAAALSADGSWVVTGESFPGFVATVWDVATGEMLRRFTDHRWIVGAAAFSSDQQRLLTAADAVREWSLAELRAGLRIVRGPGQIELQWDAGVLERSVQPGGGWEAIPEARSPWVAPIDSTSSSVFFRVRP